jgi:hypothetical protein
MNAPQPSPKRIVPPTPPPVGERGGMPYTPPKYVPPPRMDRWQRNLIVWIICAVVVFLAVAGFVNGFLMYGR